MGLFGWLSALFRGDEGSKRDGLAGDRFESARGNPQISSAALLGPRYVVLDVETTGLSPQRDRLLEVALVTVASTGRVVDEWATRINPQGPVGATHIHGITQADVANAPIFAEVLDEVARRLRGAAVVAHNARFDLAFLRAEFARAGWKMPFLPCLCTLEASSYYLPDLSRRRLADCCEAAGVRLSNAHAALGDAKATAGLLQHFMSEHLPPEPRPADLELPEAAVRVTWPTQRHPEPLVIGEPARRTVSRPAVPRTTPAVATPLVRLVSRFSLQEALDEGAHPSALAYLEKLAEVLADGVLTLEEADDLRELASIHELADADVTATHKAFVLALAHLALADGRVSRAEREELAGLTSLLGLEAKLVTQLITRAEEARHRSLSTGLAPLPATWDLGEPLRVGDKVVFTGCDEAERTRLETASEAAGVRVIGNVSRRTALLVTDGSFEGTKDARARELGTRRVTPQQYAVLLRYVQPARVSIGPEKPTATLEGDSPASSMPECVTEGRGYDAAAVRAWARAQGIDVGTRGRLPSTLVDSYLDAVRS